MSIELLEKEGLERELTIEVNVDEVNGAYKKIYKQFGSEAKIKGFRPGKTPISIIRSKFKNEVTAQVVDELVQKYYDEAVREKKLEPVGNPALTSVDIDEGKPFKFSITIEVMPQIDSISFDNLKLDSAKIEIADSEVDSVVEQLQKSQAELRAVDRSAGKEDVLICDLEIVGGDTELFEEDSYQNQEIDLFGAYTDIEFKEALVGAARDDMREITINYSASYPNHHFAGKKVDYRITVNEVKERVLPKLDDAFAKQSGQAETLLELKLNIRKQLETEAEAGQKRASKQKLIDQIVAQNEIDVPKTMLESYFRNIIEDHKKNKQEFDEKEIREKYQSTGMKAIRWYLLFHRLSVQEKIEVSAEDTENWIKRFAENYHMDISKAGEVLAKSGKSTDIRDGILEEKVLEFLGSKSVV